MKKILFHLTATFLAASSMQAAVIIVNPPTSAPFQTPGTVTLADSTFDGVGDFVGGNPENSPPVGYASNFFGSAANLATGISFVLPTLGAGETISSVTFTAYLEGNNGPVPFNLDVYGIRSNADGTWQSSDYGIGATQSGTLLQDNWTMTEDSYLTPVAATSFISTGYAAGNTVFFRISADADSATVQGTNRVWFDGANGGDSGFKPLLTITTVPEPSTYAVIAGLMVLGLSYFRRYLR